MSSTPRPSQAEVDVLGEVRTGSRSNHPDPEEFRCAHRPGTFACSVPRRAYAGQAHPDLTVATAII